MTVREITYKFLTEYSAGTPSDDVRLRPRKVYSALVDARARVLGDALPNVSENNYFTLTCVPLEKTTAHECGCIPIEGCTYYKTSCTLPESISKEGPLISDVTTLDGRIRFSQVKWTDIYNSQFDKYTANDPKYFIRNKTLFLVNVPTELKVISVRGLFTDITSLTSDCYLCDQPQDCKSALDMEFPIDRKYLPRLYQLVRFELFGKQGKEDQDNNNKEDK